MLSYIYKSYHISSYIITSIYLSIYGQIRPLGRREPGCLSYWCQITKMTIIISYHTSSYLIMFHNFLSYLIISQQISLYVINSCHISNDILAARVKLVMQNGENENHDIIPNCTISHNILSYLHMSDHIVCYHIFSFLIISWWPTGPSVHRWWHHETLEPSLSSICGCQNSYVLHFSLSLHIVTVSSLDQTQVCAYSSLVYWFWRDRSKRKLRSSLGLDGIILWIFWFSSIVWWYWYLACLLSNTKDALPKWSFVCKYIRYYCFHQTALRLHTSQCVLLSLYAFNLPAKLLENGNWMS